MKTNNLTNITKIFILITTVIIVCILCTAGFKLVNVGKSSVNGNSNNINEMASQYTDIDVSLYEGSLISGSEVVSIIKKTINDKQYLAIEVTTLNGDYATYNYIYLDNGDDKTLSEKGIQGQTPKSEIPIKKNEYGYINLMAMFLGSTYKDSNGSVVCICFEQQP